MRGLVFLLAFVSSLPLIFVSPFNGVLIWYVFSIGNFHTLDLGPAGHPELCSCHRSLDLRLVVILSYRKKTTPDDAAWWY